MRHPFPPSDPSRLPPGSGPLEPPAASGAGPSRRGRAATRAALALLLMGATVLAPAAALARAGGGSSMGSRGSRTFSAPAPTRTAPGGGDAIGRSLSPRVEPAPYAPSTPPAYAPSPAPRPAFGASPGYASPSRGSMFASGLLGGLIGAGIGGMLTGHGLFGGMDGMGSLFGLLIQVVLVVLLVRWVVRRFGGGMAAGWPMRARTAGGAMPPRGAAAASGAMPRTATATGGRTAAPPVTRADYAAFEDLLKRVQAAWSTADLGTLGRLCTPEMLGYFSEQLSEQGSRGQRNTVSDVRLEQGDLAEGWSEGAREYATVALRYSMTDVTRDEGGRVVDGSLTERVAVTELWTFLRANGGRWVLAAIQQGR